MAQGSLKQAAGLAGIVAVATAAEVAAHLTTGWLITLDAAVGLVLGVGGSLLLPRSARIGLLGLATGLLWFLGSLNTAPEGTLRAIGTFFLLSHRGPLLHLLLVAVPGRIGKRAFATVVAASWISAFLPLPAAGIATSLVAASVMAIGLSSRGSLGPPERVTTTWVALASAALAAVWALATLDVAGAATLLVVDQALIVLAGVIAFTASASSGQQRDFEASLVIQLAARRAGGTITALLARALVDPELEVRFAVPTLGWVDERGAPVDPPEGSGRLVTRATAPGGGTAALVHGRWSQRDQRLDSAAAAAAALALDATRLDAEVRERAREVRDSRQRLLSVEHAERRTLEQRLQEDVVAHITAAEEHLASDGDHYADLRREMQAAIGELTTLGEGLYPPELSRFDLASSLATLAERSPCPVSVEVTTEVTRLTEAHFAAVWFICSEALANVAKHSQASHASLVLDAQGAMLSVEIRDDGRGGATPSGGLRGLAERAHALDGTMSVDSPPGGPTVIQALIPLGGEYGLDRTRCDEASGPGALPNEIVLAIRCKSALTNRGGVRSDI